MTKSPKDHLKNLYALRSDCPVAAVLDILGDKWTLIVIRDMFLGKNTYGELQQGPESIPTNILADRLKKLQAVGIIERQLYQEKPKRYHYQLTQRGNELAPLLIELVRWGLKHIPGTVAKNIIKPYLQGKKFLT